MNKGPAMMMVEDTAKEGPSPMSESALAQSAQLPGRADAGGAGVAVQGRPEDEKLMADRKRTGRLIIDGVQNRTSLVNQTLAAFAEIVDGASTPPPSLLPRERRARARPVQFERKLSEWCSPSACTSPWSLAYTHRRRLCMLTHAYRYDTRDGNRSAPDCEIECGTCL